MKDRQPKGLLTLSVNDLLPPADEVYEQTGIVMFLHLSVILSRGAGGSPACLAGLQAHIQGEVEGCGRGGAPGPPRGKSRGLVWGVSPGPHGGGISRPTGGGEGVGGVSQHAH